MATSDARLQSEYERMNEKLTFGFIREFEQNATLSHVPFAIQMQCFKYINTNLRNGTEALRTPKFNDKKIEILQNGTIAITKAASYSIIKGSMPIFSHEPAEYIWSVKVSGVTPSVVRSNNITMGITSQHIMNAKYFKEAIEAFYCISSAQEKYRCDQNGTLLKDSYDKYFGIGDTVEIKLDLTKKRVQFSKNNGVKLTSHYRVKIDPNIQYYLTLQAHNKGIKFEVLRFRKN